MPAPPVAASVPIPFVAPVPVALERPDEVAVDAPLPAVEDALDVAVSVPPPVPIPPVLGAARERVVAIAVAAGPAGDAVVGPVGQEAMDALLLPAVEAESPVERLDVAASVPRDVVIDGGAAGVWSAARIGQA